MLSLLPVVSIWFVIIRFVIVNVCYEPFVRCYISVMIINFVHCLSECSVFGVVVHYFWFIFINFVVLNAGFVNWNVGILVIVFLLLFGICNILYPTLVVTAYVLMSSHQFSWIIATVCYYSSIPTHPEIQVSHSISWSSITSIPLYASSLFPTQLSRPYLQSLCSLHSKHSISFNRIIFSTYIYQIFMNIVYLPLFVILWFCS